MIILNYTSMFETYQTLTRIAIFVSYLFQFRFKYSDRKYSTIRFMWVFFKTFVMSVITEAPLTKLMNYKNVIILGTKQICFSMWEWRNVAKGNTLHWTNKYTVKLENLKDVAWTNCFILRKLYKVRYKSRRWKI